MHRVAEENKTKMRIKDAVCSVYKAKAKSTTKDVTTSIRLRSRSSHHGKSQRKMTTSPKKILEREVQETRKTVQEQGKIS